MIRSLSTQILKFMYKNNKNTKVVLTSNKVEVKEESIGETNVNYEEIVMKLIFIKDKEN